jgi:hypothetical protein
MLGGAVATATKPAEAIPVFAHRYSLTCQTCHTVIPHLTPFGQSFLAHGYRIPGVNPGGAFPISLRTDFTYQDTGTADPDATTTGPLPKIIVNEIELLTGGSIGSRVSYWGEQYIVDGGFPGRLRELWATYRLTPDDAKIPVVVRAGQFTLPLPLDPETFRETTQPYEIWSQVAGDNPFNFFAPKLGGQVSFGDPSRAISGTAQVMKGYEYPGVPPVGLDTMFTLTRNLGDFALVAYRYDGQRQFSGLGYGNTILITDVHDSFWRNGFAVGWSRGPTELNAVYQIGNDSAADVYKSALISSGGFIQARQALGSRAFAIARWDAISGSTFGRDLTAGLGYGVTKNSRLSFFDTYEKNFEGKLLNVISSELLVAF